MKDKTYVLGAAQLGLPYGINNKNGKLTEKEAFDILSTAYQNGITVLDTASGYGDSEKIIGRYINETNSLFKICTKYSGNNPLKVELKRTLSLLGVDSIYLYYLHKFESCKDNALMKELQDIKANGTIQNIGVSVYNPDELSFIIENISENIHTVQIPFNLFDCTRWIEPIREAKQAGINIFCRSVFLQGALFKSKEDDFVKKYHAEKYIDYIDRLCRRYRCNRETLAFSFCKSFDEITGVLFGCETKEQLEKNIGTFKNLINIDWAERLAILDKTKGINAEFTDPRLWKKV